MPFVNGTLTDFGLDPLAVNNPVLYFRASSTGIAGLNILSARKAVQAIPAPNGFFEVELVATAAVAPADTHYVVEIRYRDNANGMLVSEMLPWKLLVPAEGGALGDLLRVPANPALVFTGTEPPELATAGMWWLDPETADLAEFTGTGWQHKANLRGPAGYNATDAAGNDAAIAAFLTGPGTATATAAAAMISAAIAPKLDKTLAARTYATPGVGTALRDAAQVYIDKGTGEHWIGGAQVPTFEPIKSTVGGAVTADAITVNPAYTNTLPAIGGAALGVVGSGGALPTSWQNQVTGVSKEVLSFTTSEIVIKYGASPDRFFGGFNTNEFTVAGDQILTFDADLSNLDGSPYIHLAVSMMDGATRIAETRVIYAGEPERRVVVRFPAQTGPRRLQFRVTALTPEEAVGQQPILKIKNLDLHAAAETGDKPSLQPEWSTGAVAAREAVLNVPDGPYVLLANTPRGIIVGAGTAAAGAGLDLRAAFGGPAKITKLAVVKSAKYVPGMADFDFPKLRTAAQGQASYLTAAALAVRVPLAIDGASLRAAKQPRAIKVTRPGSAVFAVEAGDQAPGDNVTQERAEVQNQAPLPYGQSVWFSDQFRVLEFDYTGATQYTLIHQCLYTPDPGDVTGYSPEYSLNVAPQADGTIRVYTLARSGDNTVSASWQTFVQRGDWHRYVAEVQFARTGNGLLRIWFDGALVFDQAVPIGYNKVTGPTFRFGNYSRADVGPRVIEHANVEHGLASLASRITNPLPI